MRLPPLIEGIDLDAVLASLITSDGFLLWYSDHWTTPGEPVVPKRDVLGMRWLEHMDMEDVPGFLAWIADPQARGVHSMRYRALLTHKREMIYFTKLPYHAAWLCIAEKVTLSTADVPLRVPTASSEDERTAK